MDLCPSLSELPIHTPYKVSNHRCWSTSHPGLALAQPDQAELLKQIQLKQSPQQISGHVQKFSTLFSSLQKAVRATYVEGVAAVAEGWA
eukprot:519057-Pelagomonas_calceolata.AAC.1